MSMRKKLSKKDRDEQRLCFAIKACHMMGYDVEKTAYLLETEKAIVEVMYMLIEKNLVDFNSK